MGVQQFVLISDPVLVVVLAWWCHDSPMDAFVWPSSQAEFRRQWKDLFLMMGLRFLKLTLASLRPGGATSFFQESGGNVQALLCRDRRSSLVSLSHY